MVGYNEAWVRSVTFEEFALQMDCYKADTDLKADYERITGKSIEVAPIVQAPAKEEDSV